MSICVIVLYFEEKGLHRNGFVSKCIKCTKDAFEFFPAFLTEDRLLCDFDGFIIEEASDRWAIDEEDIQKFQKSQSVAIFMG